MGAAADPGMGGDPADIDDRTLAMDRKMRNAGLTAKERRVEDAADHLSPALARDFADRRIAPPRLAVDQRIHPAECLQCAVDHSPGRLPPAEFTHVDPGAPALRFTLPPQPPHIACP